MGETIHLKPIDGVRALTHLSLILLHTAMITTAHLPSTGPLWEGFRNHWIFTTFQAGAVQVDIMFMMSAFLLVYGLISSEKLPNFTTYAFRRAFRMIPSIGLMLFVGYLLGDCWHLRFRELDHTADIPSRIIVSLLLINNYFDQSMYGSSTGSLSWSCSADFHMSLIVFLIVAYLHRVTISSTSSSSSSLQQNRILLANRLKYVFFALIILSLVIRALIFDKDTRNLMKLGQYSHFGLMMTDSSYAWMKAQYNHIWHTTNAAQHISREYLKALYMPTHSRFGPFAVGGLLACNIYTAIHQESNYKAEWSIRNIFSFIVRWFFTGLSVLLLILPCIPPPPIEESTIETQFITTVAFRTLAATAGAYLLSRSLLPSSHPSSWPALSTILSFPPFQFLASISFCSYLIHFRLVMELILNPTVRSITGISLPPVVPTTPETPIENLVNQWILFMILNGLLCIVLSTLLSTLFYFGFEKPVTSFVKRVFDGGEKSSSSSTTTTTTMKEESKNKNNNSGKKKN